MKKKWIKFAVIVFVIIQLPFAIFGFSIALNVTNEGPGYLLKLYHISQEFKLRRLAKSKSLTAEPVDPLKPKSPSVITVPRSAAKSTSTRPAKIEALPTEKIDESVPRRRIDQLPVFDVSSNLGRQFANTPGLSVDYVSVPKRLKTSEPNNIVHIRIRRDNEPRVLLLAGRVGLSWYLTDPLPDSLTAIFVVAPDNSLADIIASVPNTVPIMRLKANRTATPFLRSAVPMCGPPDPRQRMNCLDVKFDRKSKEFRSALESVEQTVLKELGLPIASVSSATGYAKDKSILVPEEVVDDTVRARVEQVVAKVVAFQAAQKRTQQILKSYQQRWIDDRRQSVFDELARHPPVALEKIAPLNPRVAIISAHLGVRRNAGSTKGKPVTTYDEFRTIQNGKVGVISVRLETQIPTVVVATAVSDTDWHFDVAKDANILAVHVEGSRALTVTGIPSHIPLIVRSNAYGDRPVAGRISDPAKSKNSRREIERFLDEYNGSETTLISDKKLNLVKVTDDKGTPNHPPVRQ